MINMMNDPRLHRTVPPIMGRKEFAGWTLVIIFIMWVLVAKIVFSVNLDDEKEIQLIDKPDNGITTEVYLISVIDGDTIDVEIRKTIRIRLLDCWAPETRTKDKEEKARGLKSKKYLETFIADKELTLFVPETKKFSDMFTFGRILGHVWADEKNISQEMVESNHATMSK